jgi:hypothetical protein
LTYSGKAVHRASATGGFEAFVEGHIHALEIRRPQPLQAIGVAGTATGAPLTWVLSRIPIPTSLNR